MRGWTASVGGAVVLAATTAAAQGAPTRRELLDRADAASRAGRHGEALAAAEAAGRMQMTPSVRMFLAEEHEALAGEGEARHLVDAARAAETCVREATAQTALNNRERILARCTVLLQRINARIARVRVAGVPAGAEVRLDGEVLPEAEWNTPVEVLPGERVVEVRVAGGGVFRRAVRLAAGASETVTVVLAAPPAVENATPGAGAGAGDVARDDMAPPTWPRVVGWSLVGVGAVSLGVSAWQWANTSGYADDAANGTGDHGGAWARYADAINPANAAGARALSIDDVCERARADAGNADARGAASLCDAHAQARAMAIAFGVGGGVLAVAGVVLVAVAPRARAARVAVAPLVGAGVGGAAVGGAF
ncbi:MAG: hypothetical protein U0324_34980 [Polyangiales bacterium]